MLTDEMKSYLSAKASHNSSYTQYLWSGDPFAGSFSHSAVEAASSREGDTDRSGVHVLRDQTSKEIFHFL